MAGEPTKPLIGIPVSRYEHRSRDSFIHGIVDKYVDAAADGADAIPLLIPALGEATRVADLLAGLDGLMLSGGRANVEPHHYGGPPFPDDEHRDPARDATALPLVRAAVDAGVPVLGMCRGIQEMNVALGGSLHYRVHLVPGMLDHRMPPDGDVEEQFALRHPLALTPGGLLAELAGATEVLTNSLHGQGIDRLADGLVVEARAPDGLIEAVRLEGAKRFTVGVQWHAEWRFRAHPLSHALLRAFGEAARERARERTGGGDGRDRSLDGPIGLRVRAL